MSRRSSTPLWLLGAVSVVLLLATLSFFLVRHKVCPDCDGAGAVRFPDVQMSRGLQPVATINCPRCHDHGKVSSFQALIGPRFAPQVRQLISCERNGTGDRLESEMDGIIQRDGRNPVEVLGRSSPSSYSFRGWARFIGESSVLYLNHNAEYPGRKGAIAVLIDREGHVTDFLSCSCDSKQGWVAPRFNAENDGGLIELNAEERNASVEFQLKHAESVERMRRDPAKPKGFSCDVIRFRVDDGRLKMVESP